MTGVCEGHAFLVKRRAESRERGRPRPQQRVSQKADALTSLGNHTAHRNLNRPFTERAGTPALVRCAYKTRPDYTGLFDRIRSIMIL
jgi:hypothetical protein